MSSLYDVIDRADDALVLALVALGALGMAVLR